MAFNKEELINVNIFSNNRFTKFIRQLAVPAQKELPLMLITMALLTPNTLKYVLLYNDAYPPIEYFRYLSLAFSVSYLSAAVVCAAGKRWLKVVAYAVPSVLFVVNLYLWVVFKRMFSPLLAVVVGETNVKEAGDFLSSYVINRNGLMMVGVIGIIALTIVLGERLRKRIAAYMGTQRKAMAIGYGVMAGLLCGVVSTEVYVSLFQCRTSNDLENWGHNNHDVEPMDLFSAVLYAGYGPFTAKEELKMAVKATEEACRLHPSMLTTEPLTVVFVMGESHIRCHSHLYGYPLDTSPCMDLEQKAGRLFAFDNVISPYNLTTISMKNVVCTNSIADGEQWYEYPFFPAIFKQAGFTVFSWDNQRTMSEDEVFTFALNSFLYNPSIQELSYDDTNEACFQHDGALIDDFFSSHPFAGVSDQLSDKPTLILFHLMGQHFTPEHRYPHDGIFEHFTADSIHSNVKGISPQQRAEIAYYDNATRYVDHLLGAIVEKLRGRNAVMIYLSDHGEEMYDYRLSRGRTSEADISRQMADHQNAIPFFVWCSDSYCERHPDIIGDLKAALHRPAMSDNTSQLLFRLAQISTSCYRPDRDISHPSFKKRRRTIYNQFDYDQL